MFFCPKHIDLSYSSYLNSNVDLGIPKASVSSSILCTLFDKVLRISFSLQLVGQPERGSYESLKFPSRNLVNYFRYVRSKRSPSPYIVCQISIDTVVKNDLDYGYLTKFSSDRIVNIIVDNK